MKKEFNPASLSSRGELNLLKKDIPANETAAFLQLNLEIAAVLGFRNSVTPLFVQPLDKALNRSIKRAMDIIISMFTIIILLSWLIPLIAILIKLDSKGPVFFLQKRNKRNSELFTCLKFRSMFVNADADFLPAVEDDQRITRLGKFLRNHFLDELPQFFNVLWGDMSIIGPRPHMVRDNDHFEKTVKNYSYRHKVKPGITGLAQVLGYVGLADEQQKIEARVNIDIFYVRHWCTRMDGIILFRTARKIAGFKESD